MCVCVLLCRTLIIYINTFCYGTFLSCNFFSYFLFAKLMTQKINFIIKNWSTKKKSHNFFLSLIIMFFLITTVTTVPTVATMTTVTIVTTVTKGIVKYQMFILCCSKGNFFTNVLRRTDIPSSRLLELLSSGQLQI